MEKAGLDAAAVLAAAGRRRRLPTAIGRGIGLPILLIALPAPVLVLAGQASGDGAPRRGGLGLAGALAAAFAPTRLVRRCPACAKPLGARTSWLLPGSFFVCPWCGARLAPNPERDRGRVDGP